MVKFNGFYFGPCHGNQVFMKKYQDQNDGIYGFRAGLLGTPSNGASDTTLEQIMSY